MITPDISFLIESSSVHKVKREGTSTAEHRATEFTGNIVLLVIGMARPGFEPMTSHPTTELSKLFFTLHLL